jgi:Rrf2 family protein
MLTVTSEVAYATKALAELSLRGPMSAKTISELTNSPNRWLLQILRKLTLAGILNARRGVTGGYELARTPISLLNVIEALQGPFALTGPLDPALLGRAEAGIPALRQHFDSVRVA